MPVRRTLLAALAALALPVDAAPVSARAPESPDELEARLAPDGRIGFGRDLEIGGLRELLRDPEGADARLLEELAQLPLDVSILAASSEALYRERGYFDLIGSVPNAGIDDLHAAFRAHDAEPQRVLERGGLAALALARMHLDTRFRVRARLLETWGPEAETIERALSAFRGMTEGWVDFSPEELEVLLARVDLSAAFLRALRSDLQALRETPGGGFGAPPLQSAVDRFLGIAHRRDADARRRAYDASRSEQRRRDADMQGVLFTARLERELADWLAWREARDLRAGELLAAARRAHPDNGDAPSDVRRLSKTRRLRLVRERAVEGLVNDPLDDELAYMAAQSASVVESSFAAMRLYDRYLSLHGIRFNDDRSWGDRPLTWEEERALIYVQMEEKEFRTPLGTIGN